MRVAYIAPYQGPVLISRRPSRINLSLAGNLKIELVAELLRARSHDVEILSQGEVVENSATYFPAFSECTPSSSAVPVHYASALPLRFVNGRWSSQRLLTLFKQRHAITPFDIVLIYNLKLPQVACAIHARSALNLPVIVEYEDESFVDIHGRAAVRLRDRLQLGRARAVLGTAAACVGVSPHILSRFSAAIPRLLLRGVISTEIMKHMKDGDSARHNRVVYSGTFAPNKGLVQLVQAWKLAGLRGWELHLAGEGVLGDEIRRQAADCPSIVLHGLLDREQNARLLNSSRIGINPHDLSATPGNVFAFKIIEYLASDLHVISTPMGTLEAELEAGVTYMTDNQAETIAKALQRVVDGHAFHARARDATVATYGPTAVADSLDDLLDQACGRDVVGDARQVSFRRQEAGV